MSYRLKLDRALKHAQCLQNEIAAWIDAKPSYPFVLEKDPQPQLPDRHVIKFMDSPEVPIEWSLHIGEILHNLRSGLDHLAYELAVYNAGGPLPDDVAGASEFPIAKDCPWFKAHRKAKIGSIGPGAQAVIQGLQPYNRGQAYASDPLWRLHELVNIDKHRLLLVGEYVSVAVAMGGPQSNFILNGPLELRPGRHEPGAVVGFLGKLPRPSDPSRPMRMDLDFFMDVLFKDGPAAGENPPGCLMDMHTYIVREVVGKLEPFLF